MSSSEDDIIRDVYDGALYKELFDDSGFFRGIKQIEKSEEFHLSLQLNSDGVALFNSSKFSLWPVYGIINEFPPHLRYKIRN